MFSIWLCLRIVYYGLLAGGMCVAWFRGQRTLAVGVAMALGSQEACHVLDALPHHSVALGFLKGLALAGGLFGALLIVRAFAASVGHQRVDLRVLMIKRRYRRPPS